MALKRDTRGWHYWLAGVGTASGRSAICRSGPTLGRGSTAAPPATTTRRAVRRGTNFLPHAHVNRVQLLLVFAKTRSGQRREPQERFLPTHTCVVGAYGEVFANNTCILSGHLQAPWCNSTDGCGAVTFRYAQQGSGVVGRFWLSERMRLLPSHAPDSGRKAFAAL